MLLIQDFESLKKDIRQKKEQQFTRLIEQCGWYSAQELSNEPPPTSITHM